MTLPDLSGASRIAVLTGAGVSAESGIPTFRGPGGLWREYRAEDLATPDAFRRDPKLVWEWYDWRRGIVAEARPNPGHEALAQWEEKGPEFVLITQNVDGLHTLAGSRNILELHGNIWRTRCTSCPAAGESREVPLPEIPPACGDCGGLLRPDIVWFGESLDPNILGAAIEASRTCDLFVVVGTSGVVQPAASLAAMALDAGATLVEINPDPTPISAVAHHRLPGKAGEVLPRLVPY